MSEAASPIRVLIVDDDRDIREIWVSSRPSEGFAVGNVSGTARRPGATPAGRSSRRHRPRHHDARHGRPDLSFPPTEARRPRRHPGGRVDGLSRPGRRLRVPEQAGPLRAPRRQDPPPGPGRLSSGPGRYGYRERRALAELTDDADGSPMSLDNLPSHRQPDRARRNFALGPPARIVRRCGHGSRPRCRCRASVTEIRIQGGARSSRTVIGSSPPYFAALLKIRRRASAICRGSTRAMIGSPGNSTVTASSRSAAAKDRARSSTRRPRSVSSGPSGSGEPSFDTVIDVLDQPRDLLDLQVGGRELFLQRLLTAAHASGALQLKAERSQRGAQLV